MQARNKQASKFTELARTVVQHHFGSKPRRIKPLSGGLSNLVFEAAHKEGDFVVRISPDKSRINTFVKEQWAETAARKKGVPTAEILETGFSLISFPYMISRKTAGVEATYHSERKKIISELGHHAAQINKIRTKGFGETFDWSNNQLSRNETLKEYLENEFCYEAKTRTLAQSGLLPRSTIKGLRKIRQQLEKIKSKPTLNHGDLRLKNVIADEKARIVAILDWEKAISTLSPHWEISLALHDLGVDEQEQFTEGYGLKPRKLAEIAPYIKAFNILNYADEINRVTREKDKLGLERLRMRFNRTFDLYSL